MSGRNRELRNGETFSADFKDFDHEPTHNLGIIKIYLRNCEPTRTRQASIPK